MLEETLESLCRLSGVSGGEDEVRDYILARVRNQVDEVRQDPLGNLLVWKRGAVSPARRVMLCAHMDEVGLMVTCITDEGCLRFAPVGGLDRRVLPGKKVFVGPAHVPGVTGTKAHHLTTAKERGVLPPVEEMFIDIGAGSRAEAARQVQVGDLVCFEPTVVSFGNGLIKAKAIDDRVGCAVMVELAQQALPCDCVFAFTAQEEVGARGAAVAARTVRPQVTLVLEGTTAADLPSREEADRVCSLGRGVVIPVMDKGTIYHRPTVRALIGLAEAHGIPWQGKSRITGGTDGSAIQRSGSGSAVAALSVPVRNIHSPSSVARRSECRDQLRLAELFLESCARQS